VRSPTRHSRSRLAAWRPLRQSLAPAPCCNGPVPHAARAALSCGSVPGARRGKRRPLSPAVPCCSRARRVFEGWSRDYSASSPSRAGLSCASIPAARRGRPLLPSQIPIDGQLPTGFPRVPSSEAFGRAGPFTPGRPLMPGRHPKLFTIAAVRRAGIEMLDAQGRFGSARGIVELRTKRSSAPDRGQTGGGLTSTDRAAPWLLSGRRCRSPR
jgi:hypothetical protein